MRDSLHRAALGVLAALLVAAAAQAAGLKSGAFEPPRVAPGFRLLGSDGAELSLERYRGKVVALAFGYTFCPDVCPTTLLELAQVRKSLGAAAVDFQVIYVTVDPERDTPEQLRKWLAFFDPSFIGATGGAAQLAAVLKAYGVAMQKVTPVGTQAAYLIHHSSSVYLIDREGRLRAMMPFGGSADDLIHDVKLLLASAGAGQTAAPGVRVIEAWARRAPMMEGAKGGSNSAVYAKLLNAGAQADALVGGSTDAAAAVEVHESYRHNGMMMMRPVPRVALAPGKDVELKPGGYHVMLLNLKRELKPGDTLRLTLEFENAGKLPVEAVVR